MSSAPLRLDKISIGVALREIAILIELTGGNRFKAKAYVTGAHALESLRDSDFAELFTSGRLTDVPGIGDALSSQITALASDGQSPVLEKLRRDTPRGAWELSQIPGMTLKRMRVLSETLAIDSVESLKLACEEHRVRTLRGFGPKTESSLLRGIEKMRAPLPSPSETLLAEALAEANDFVAYARGCYGVKSAEIAGAVRRWKETVRKIELVVTSDEPQRTATELSRYPAAARVESAEPPSIKLHLRSGIHAEAHLASGDQAAITLVRTTGSTEHLAKLEARAASRGASLDTLEARTEVDLYGHLGLSFVPPELREGTDEIELASRGDTFADLIAVHDILGMLHCHTVHSDGRNTVLEMAREAEAMGMKYLTITDHSPNAHYAGGLDIDGLKRQWDEIAAAQEQVDIRLLRGTESDILADGALDYPDDVLEQLDVVIASVHARYKMDEEAMTKRIVTAMKKPVFKIWGHALGRILLHRAPIACRVDEILDAVASSRAAIEVNGDPHRLDLPAEWIREARAREISFVISVDAHSTRGMHNLRFGVETARRGGMRKSEVLNARSASAFMTAVRPAA